MGEAPVAVDSEEESTAATEAFSVAVQSEAVPAEEASQAGTVDVRGDEEMPEEKEVPEAESSETAGIR